MGESGHRSATLGFLAKSLSDPQNIQVGQNLSDRCGTFYSFDLRWPISLNTVFLWPALGAFTQLLLCSQAHRKAPPPLHNSLRSATTREAGPLALELCFEGHKGPFEPRPGEINVFFV